MGKQTAAYGAWMKVLMGVATSRESIPESSSCFHHSFDLTLLEQLWERIMACVNLVNSPLDCWLQKNKNKNNYDRYFICCIKGDDVLTALEPIQQLTSNQSLSLIGLQSVFDVQLHSWTLLTHLTASSYNILEIIWFTNVLLCWNSEMSPCK